MKLDLDDTEDNVMAILKASGGDVGVLRIAANALVDELKNHIEEWSAENLAIIIANMCHFLDIKISN